jgi:hypothetical protein
VLHLGEAKEDGGGLLDGIKDESGRALVELAGGDSLNGLAEGKLHGANAVEGWENQRTRLAAAESQSATETAGAVSEVVVAVFASVHGSGGAVDSVFFDVVASCELHKGQIPFD